MDVRPGGGRRLSEPRLAPGSPPIATEGPKPAHLDRVFIDTSALLTADDDLPLLICAQEEDLQVHWSPFVVSELARVPTRETAIAAVQRGYSAAQLRAPLEAVRVVIDQVVTAHEQAWHCPDPLYVRASHQQLEEVALADEQDRPILAGALAVGARFLLSRDKRQFPHGESVSDVWCWHPDTYLTALFQNRPDIYRRVRLRITDMRRAGPLLPNPLFPPPLPPDPH